MKIAIAFGLLLLGCHASVAHHSFAVEFTAERTATISGTVREVWFRNPHVRYYIDVNADNGDVERWDTRAGSPALLTRRGWTKTSIQAGDEVTLHGYSGREEGSRLLSIIWVELADGTRFE